MTTPSEITAVIPSFRGVARIGPTLQALAVDAPGLATVLVDDGSDDDTSRAGQRDGAGLRLEVVRHPVNRGRAAARNTGVRAARTEWVLLLDDDMELGVGAVAAHRAAQGLPGGAQRAFLGRIVLPGNLPPGPFTDFLLREAEDRHRKLTALREDVPWAHCLTGQLSVRRQVLLDCGLFDEALSGYGFEDIELGIRLRRAGVRLAYLPEARSVHRAYALDLRRLRERTFESGLGALRLAAAHANDPEVRSFLRLDGMGRIDLRDDTAFLVAMRLLNRLLQRPWILRGLAGRRGQRALDGMISALEHLPARRLRDLAYHFVRDVAYYHGIAEARAHGGAAPSLPAAGG
jgi:GT2 family glycosyltransferase